MASEGADGVAGSKAGGASGRRVATTPAGKANLSKDLTDGKPRKPMKEDRSRGGREDR